MLTKNVYILFGPGYSGNYVNWAISYADLDRRVHTVADPINDKTDTKLGGAGTGHLHTRIPTHQALIRHLIWTLYNRPTEPHIYVINLPAGNHLYSNMGVYDAIRTIACYDTTGIFISINDHNNDDVRSMCEINCVIKWPTYLAATMPGRAWNDVMDFQLHPEFDPFDCANDILFRDWAVNTPNAFTHNRPLQNRPLDELLQRNVQWYQVRNQYQPHEVNEQHYVTDFDMTNRVFDIGVMDIIGPDFPECLEMILQKSDVSSAYDLQYLHEFHPKYTSAQVNLQWFQSIAQWYQTGELDQYLLSHSIIQAQVIRTMIREYDAVLMWGYRGKSLQDINQWYQTNRPR